MRLEGAPGWGAAGPPPAGALRVRVMAVGLNFADVFAGLGLYSATPEGDFVPGLEFSGVVEAVGEEGGTLGGGAEAEPFFVTDKAQAAAIDAARGIRVGTRVMGVLRFGAYASRVDVAAHQVRRVPPGWSFAEGAGFLVQGLTVYYGLVSLGAARRGQVCLVHSAAGGCGLLALAICSKLGVRVIGTVGSEAKVEAILSRFPELDRGQIIVRERERFGEQLDAALGVLGAKGFDIVLDAIQGDFFWAAFERLKTGGRHVCYGAADLTPAGDRLGPLGFGALGWKYVRRPRVDPMDMMQRNVALMCFNLIWMFGEVEQLSRDIDELLALDLDPPRVGMEIPFEETPRALRLLQSGRTTGKVVLTLRPGAPCA